MPAMMTPIKAAIIAMMSSRVPVTMVTSMNRLQSHTISRPKATRPMPVTMRVSIFSRMPDVLRHIHLR